MLHNKSGEIVFAALFVLARRHFFTKQEVSEGSV